MKIDGDGHFVVAANEMLAMIATVNERLGVDNDSNIFTVSVDRGHFAGAANGNGSEHGRKSTL